MSTRRRLCGSTIVSLLVMMQLQLVPPAAASAAAEPAAAAVADGCATRCRELCGALPESEDPGCAGRCDTISAAFNGSAAVTDPKTAFSALREMHMCHAGCSLRCAGAVICMSKCAEAFRLLGPTMAALGSTVAAAGPAAPPPEVGAGGHAADPKFQATCSEACSRKCASSSSQGQAATKLQPAAECGGICAEACGLYGGAATVLQAAMPPAAVPSAAELGARSVDNTFKACSGQCAGKGDTCSTKCSYASYILTKAKANMKLATGAFGLPAH